MKPVDHLVILSGGIDSTTILAKVIDEYGKDHVGAINFFYGQKHAKEMGAAKRIAGHYGVGFLQMDLRGVFDCIEGNALTDPDNVAMPEGHYSDPSMRQTVVPFRNLVFISSAAAYAGSIGAKSLYMGVHAGDHPIYPDCRANFVEAAREVLRVGYYEPLKLETPFIDSTKAEIVEFGLQLGIPYELTWTCYEGEIKPCKRCGACIERVEAFSLNGVEDPLVLG
ncbi:MAG: 7-cyano-7-deazaguanine synthase QueC [bacterium]